MQNYKPENKEENKRIQEARHTSNTHEYPLSPWQLTILEKYPQYIVGPILDVGARNGLLVEELNKKGLDAIGIEITDIADYAVSMGRNVIKGDIQERTQWNDGHFKTIIATHVIEHCYDVESAVNEIRRILDGYAIFAYPLMVGVKEGLQQYGHYIGFESKEEFPEYLQSHGFEIVDYIDGGDLNQIIVAKTK